MNSTNFYQDELQKFDSMANQWWDLSGPCKALHALNPIRINYIQKFCQVIGKQVIDVGCGGGILSEGLAQQGGIVTGIDLNQSLISVARLHLYESKQTVQYELLAVETVAQQHANQYDIVACMEMLEHVPDPAAIILNCARLVKPNGFLFFSTINQQFKAYLYAILGAEYCLGLLPKGTHDYEKFITPATLSQYARQANLQLIDLQGIDYQPLQNKFIYTEDLSVNYLACFQKTV